MLSACQPKLNDDYIFIAPKGYDPNENQQNAKLNTLYMQ